MVQAIVKIDEEANRIINIVKAKYSLKDKSEAINLITREYGEDLLEPELRPEYKEKVQRIVKDKHVSRKEFEKEVA